MLKSENSSNNEEDESQNLLTLGKRNLLTFEKTNSDGGFMLTTEEANAAMTTPFDALEGQALQYFSGYIFKKLVSFHDTAETCEICQKFAGKLTKDTTVITDLELFTLLKTYDERSTLYSPVYEFVSFVGSIARLVNYCCKRYLSRNCFLQSLNDVVKTRIIPPQLCSPEMIEKIMKHTVKTLFHYKLKLLNEKVKDDGKKSKRKLKILKHQ